MNQRIRALTAARAKAVNEARTHLEAAEKATGGDVVKAASRAYEAAMADVRRIDGELAEERAYAAVEADMEEQARRAPGQGANADPYSGLSFGPTNRTVQRDYLTATEPLTGWVERRESVSADERSLGIGRAVRGLALGRWDGAEAEQRVMGTGTGSAGGYVVPTFLSAQILDAARAASVVVQAGASTFPLTTDETTVAKITGDPSAAWRAEHAPIPESDIVLGQVTFRPKALACITRVSRELMEDGQAVEETVRNSIAQAIASEFDRAALLGSGVAPEPQGVFNDPGVTQTALDASPDYDDLVDAAGRVEDNNHTATAFVYAPRTGRTIGKLKTTDGQYVTAPASLDGIQRLRTTKVPVNLGVGVNASLIVSGDFPQLFFGVRTELQITILTEKYADVGEIGILSWFRGDIAVARPEAFDVITGVLA